MMQRRPGMSMMRPPLVEDPAVSEQAVLIDRPVLQIGALGIELGAQVAPPLINGQLVPAAQSLPVLDTQSGNVFHDRNDPNLLWYLPALNLRNPDPAFAFAASQSGVDSQGNPFNQAKLTLDVSLSDPADVQQARQQQPAATFKQISFISQGVTLSVPYKDANGADQTNVVSGHLVNQADGSYRLLIDGLFGASVIQAYVSLTQTGGASVGLQLTFQGWRQIGGGPPVEYARQPAAAQLAMQPSPEIDPLVESGGPPTWPFPSRWILASGQLAPTFPLGLTFRADQYRPSYTLTANGATRPIIDVSDLRGFAVARSEYRELTSLGDVATKYPSFRRLYFGQVTATVVAIPAAYGIVRASTGCAARLDALVDTSVSSISGCRFHFTFTLAPVVDPNDLAGLARDLSSIPEANGRTLRLTLPTGIDNRVPGVLVGDAPTNVVYESGVVEHSVLLSLDINDDSVTPAISKVNLFLTELCASHGFPLFGQVGVRLDDAYSPPITSDVILNLHQTSSADDLSLALAGSPVVVTATDVSPYDLHLLRFGAYDANSATVTAFDQVVAAGQSVNLPVANASPATTVLVERMLALPDPIPTKSLRRFVDIHTETIQQTQHPLSINSTAVDYGAAGYSELDIQISLNDLPGLPIPSITLTPDHRVDSVNVLVPVDSVIAGLGATLSVTVVPTDSTMPNTQVELLNDFVTHPILVLVPSMLQ